REIEDVGTAAVATVPEPDPPQSARAHAAGGHPERPDELSVGRPEGVDLAVEIAEVADQESVAEPAEARRRQGDPPGCGESAAGDPLLYELPVLIENRERPGAERGTDLVDRSFWRIGDVKIAAELLHVERNQPLRQQRVDKGTGCQPQRPKGVVEDVDAAADDIGGVKARLRAVDRQTGVSGAAARDLEDRRRTPIPGRNR